MLLQLKKFYKKSKQYWPAKCPASPQLFKKIMIYRYNKKISLPPLLILFLGALACTLFTNNPILTNENPTKIVATHTVVSVSASPSVTPSPLPPTPLATMDDPAIVAETNPGVEFNFADLSPYHQAMLPEFADDVETVAATGASRYDIEVEVEFPESGEARLAGNELVRYTNTEARPLSEIYFRLYPNLPGYGGEMRVEEVLVDNTPIEPILEAEDSALRAPLTEPLQPGETTIISLTFQATAAPTVNAGYNVFSYSDQTLAMAGFYPVIAVYDDEGWNIEVPPPYGDATYLDVSLYQVQLTVPESMVVAASGSQVGSQANEDGTKTLALVSGPMRDFYIVMRADFEAVSELVDGIVVTSIYPPELKSGSILALRYAADALRVFNERFGPYPYAEFEVVATPTTAGGVEYPGIVVVSKNLYGQSGGFFQHATAHEVAHQWWYGLVGNDQVDEPWLDEALTNYSTILYWEEIEGPDTANRIIEDFFRGPYERAKENGQDRAVAGPVSDFSEGEYGVFVYGKGPLFFEALRQDVGDDLFLDIMKSYYAEYKYKIARPDDLLTIIERVSGRDIRPLFETWIE